MLLFLLNDKIYTKEEDKIPAQSTKMSKKELSLPGIKY